jgi:thiosulfate dehydrogenase
MSVTPGDGSSIGELDNFTIQYDLSSLPIDVYVGTIFIEDTGSSPVPAGNSPQVITVTVNVRSVLGDFDLDGDVDLDDYSHLQNCFSTVVGFPPPLGCDDALLDDDVDVDAQDLILFRGCMSGMNVLANKHCDDLQQFVRDETRGGAMYDNWWVVAGLPAPATDHPLWQFRPDQVTNTATGSATHRCKECHGWDYKGADGAYGTGSHHTGFPGIYGSALSPLQVFLTLKLTHTQLPNGHSFGDLGMSDQDLWDITEFVTQGVINTDLYVDASKNILGNTVAGNANYNAVCNVCHGAGGTGFLPSGHDTLGQVAMDNPWEALHKIRFGSPGSPMPTAESSGWNLTNVVDTGAYVQTLPGGQVP